ncbi:MAG: hypothetical protein WAU91_13780 [Desulfatitalea sp.]
MRDPLNAIVESYGQLEIALQQRMRAVCALFCDRCGARCCRVDFCHESLESPFLVHVRARFAPSAYFDAVTGWLTPAGCGLAAGRPPVCYEFLCRAIVEAQPTRHQLEALETLAMLLTHAGRNAFGRRHLVALEDLHRLNSRRLWKQLMQARSVLDELPGRLTGDLRQS